MLQCGFDFHFPDGKNHAIRYHPCEDSSDSTGDKAQTHGITSDHKAEGEEEREEASEEGRDVGRTTEICMTPDGE